MKNLVASDLVVIREHSRHKTIDKVVIELTNQGYWVIRVYVTTGEVLYLHALHGYPEEEITFDSLDIIYDLLQSAEINNFEVVS